ncbi:MAG: hypothetical protein ACM3QW_05340, partial [Ignavibacteriales bacterium]
IMTALQSQKRNTSFVVYRPLVKFLIGLVLVTIISSCQSANVESSHTASPVQKTGEPKATQQIKPTKVPASPPVKEGMSRGYLTTPKELAVIAEKAGQGMEPYQGAVSEVLLWANMQWDFKLSDHVNCPSSDRPAWNDNSGGTPIVYAKALAYHLTGNVQYAEDVKNILERIMTEVKTIDINTEECRLVFGWGTPELVASADLIEDYWWDQTCTGPLGTLYTDTQIGSGNCKRLFQNWLVKNPYYIVSYSAVSSKSNWGAAATNTTAYIADYLWDRTDVLLLSRNPPEINGGEDLALTPSEAFKYANQLALDRMNGYGVELRSSSSCDYLSGIQQNSQWPPVKSQITEKGIISEDARRQEQCNIPVYNGEYENYPQIHLGHNIQQCELMLRRGDSSCYDNVDNTNLPNYTFIGPDGETKTTHLYPGRGSIERAIKAIIVDSNTEWRHDSALWVAYRYYLNHHRLQGFDSWAGYLKDEPSCSQDICFGALTQGFSIENEKTGPPPVTSPP